MRALQLDLVRQPRALRIAGAGLLLAVVAAAAYMGQLYMERMDTAEQWEMKRTGLQKAQRREAPENGPAQKLRTEQLASELNLANRIIGRLSMPWDALFHEVETAVDERIGLLNVEPDTEKNELRITAEAKNLTAMLEYQKRLSDIALFSDVHVISHQMQQKDPLQPVRFVLNARWLAPAEAANRPGR